MGEGGGVQQRSSFPSVDDNEENDDDDVELENVMGTNFASVFTDADVGVGGGVTGFCCC